jgi:hypothetical protein
MYNKLFSKILTSSIWLENKDTRLVWITLLAAMDEDGFCNFAAMGNLARTAGLTLKETREAVKILESPDDESSDPSNEGRRIERIPGGWIVLNAPKYREMVTRAVIKEGNRLRMQEYRKTKGAESERSESATTMQKPRAKRRNSGPDPMLGVWKGES